MSLSTEDCRFIARSLASVGPLELLAIVQQVEAWSQARGLDVQARARDIRAALLVIAGKQVRPAPDLEPARDLEIDALYAELTVMANRGDREGYQRCLATLRSLQAEEAAALATFFESRRTEEADRFADNVARAHELLKRHETPAKPH